MKKTLYIVLAAAGTGLWSCSQHITAANLPSLVQNSVKARYPQAQTMEWEKAGDFYEAEFDLNGVEHTVQVDATGAITKVKQDVALTALPAVLDSVLKQEYSAYLLDDLEQVEANGQVYYQAELENKNEELKKVFTAQGAVATLPYWE